MHESPLKYARVAGLLYLIIITCGIAGEVVIRSSLIVSSDVAQTVSNILAAPFLFRMGFITDLIMLLADVAISIVLFQMFLSVNRTLSLTAMVFRLVQATILGLNLLNYSAAQLLIEGKGVGAVETLEAAHEFAMMYLNIHAMGYDLGLVFFAVSTLAIAFLLIRSSFAPSALGVALIAAAVVYFIGGMIRFLFPQWVEHFEPVYIIPLVTELVFCIWLLSRNAKLPGREH
jgi:hypothetical protein